jgi:hypothetical protein
MERRNSGNCHRRDSRVDFPRLVEDEAMCGILA